MCGLSHIEFIILVHIIESKIRRIDPSSSLDKKINKIIHRISFCQSLWYVLQVEFIIFLAVDTEAKNTILC